MSSLDRAHVEETKEPLVVEVECLPQALSLSDTKKGAQLVECISDIILLWKAIFETTDELSVIGLANDSHRIGSLSISTSTTCLLVILFERGRHRQVDH